MRYFFLVLILNINGILKSSCIHTISNKSVKDSFEVFNEEGVALRINDTLNLNYYLTIFHKVDSNGGVHYSSSDIRFVKYHFVNKDGIHLEINANEILSISNDFMTIIAATLMLFPDAIFINENCYQEIWGSSPNYLRSTDLNNIRRSYINDTYKLGRMDYCRINESHGSFNVVIISNFHLVKIRRKKLNKVKISIERSEIIYGRKFKRALKKLKSPE